MAALLVSALVAVLALTLKGSTTRHTRRSESAGGLAGTSPPPRTILTVDPTHLGKQFAVGTIGLSTETEELASHDLSANHRSLVTLMRLLGPAVLRVGGNSLDRSWWTSDAEQPPAWATSVITPADLVNLRQLLAATDWKVILGVNLGHFDPTRAANEARIAAAILGPRLIGVEIGNEPDGYSTPSIDHRDSSYNVSAYLKEVSVYSMAIHASSPTLNLYGPDLAVPTTWLPAIASDPQMPFAELTEHYYPTTYNVPRGACKGTPVPTAAELLSQQGRARENEMLQTLVRAGELAHRPTRISETNTTASCDDSGGPDTGPVFASALWSLDWALRAAEAGVNGLNFHGYFGLCAPSSYSPVCAPTNAAEARGQVIANPEYYGLLAARQLEGGRFIPVDISTGNTTGNLTEYATIQPHGAITLALDNFATKGSDSIVFSVPGYHKATSETLIGPSINATRSVTFGHARTLRPPKSNVSRLNDAFQIKLAPASAMIITLHK